MATASEKYFQASIADLAAKLQISCEWRNLELELDQPAMKQSALAMSLSVSAATEKWEIDADGNLAEFALKPNASGGEGGGGGGGGAITRE